MLLNSTRLSQRLWKLITSVVRPDFRNFILFLPLGRGAETGAGVFVGVERVGGVFVGDEKGVGGVFVGDEIGVGWVFVGDEIGVEGVFLGDEIAVGDEGRVLDLFLVLALSEVLFLGRGAETGVGDKG